ncbi:branched-chain amino acid ABC transporter permease [Cereibacter sediminicola]|uniref:branched-chain amino acid ABC transporter permease n=1 Tax=Cereibacter sediminicola TaxID=2584941 RepID=UPI0011A66790|nr:branched-chain amino acid ABC transporter permease [Cereibacter sediminicola]
MEFGPFLLLAGMEGLVGAAVLALTAAGLSLVFGVMRVVNVAHGEFFMLGAVAAWFVSQWVPGPPAAAFAVALVACPLLVAGLAALADRLVLKRLAYEPEATIIATIGLLYILQQAALSLYGPEARPVPPPFEARMQLPWFGWSGYKLFVIGAAGAVLAGLWLLLSRSRIGLVMRATQVDRETATAFGIDVDRVYAATFALGAGLAAIAAVLIVPIQQAHYLMGGDPLLLSFIVVVIGGLGSLRGTLVAALLIGVSDGVISTFFEPTLAKILATLLVALVLVFRPQGLFGARA